MNNNRLRTFIIKILPAILYAGLIFFLSSLPSDKLKVFYTVSDFILHIVEYFIFAVLLIIAFSTTNWRVSRILIVVFVVGVLYAISDEYHQSFVPGRVCSVMDIIADTIGIIIGLGIYNLFNRYRIGRG